MALKHVFIFIKKRPFKVDWPSKELLIQSLATLQNHLPIKKTSLPSFSINLQLIADRS